ncbi:hypothetical protein SUGI_0424190 [Cryptomeria japonica]|nr:hypothetical protein SUGI_0424190 [Cryptomeria japonica]
MRVSDTMEGSMENGRRIGMDIVAISEIPAQCSEISLGHGRVQRLCNKGGRQRVVLNVTTGLRSTTVSEGMRH